jgi:CRISPR-associated endonuclease Cas2
MSLLISYDIEHNSFRQKIANHLIDAGFTRVQYSVYLGSIKESAISPLMAWLHQLPQEKRWQSNDSVLVLSLTSLQVQQMVLLGNPKWDTDDLSGERHTFIM